MGKRVEVCTGCGKIKGRHYGWDVSCEIHSMKVNEEDCEFDEHGRVTKIKAPEGNDANAKTG